MITRVVLVWVLVLLACCLLPASDRVELDRSVGEAEARGLRLRVEDGLAAVRAFDGQTLTLWAQAPDLSLHVISREAEARPLVIEVHNCVPDAVLTGAGFAVAAAPLEGRAAGCRFSLSLSGEVTLRIAPADADGVEPYVFLVLSDIQRAIGKVDDVFARMNEDEEARFVVSTGDLANTGTRPELLEIQQKLGLLRLPLFSTVGNHEMGAPPRHWHELFGRFNPHFAFKGVSFSLVDSGNATLDPTVYDWLSDWLDDARDHVHVVLTHVPPLDPVGLRGGGFRSRKEGAKLLARLGQGRVDALFLGHIHSYYAFSSAGVPTYLSGGGGAIEEKLDGVGRHYLRVRVTPDNRIDDVSVVRVD